MRYELILWLSALLKLIPGNIGVAIRCKLLPVKIGMKSKIWDNIQIDTPSKLTIGENSSINRGGIINCGGGVEIGDNVLIGPNVTIYSQNHNYKNREEIITHQGYDKSPVIIESDSWIAASCIILPGVKIAEGTVVAAGSVVTKSTEAYSVYAGLPAKKIAERM
ncbi:acyltransferase [Vibrio sp. F13]|uniref:acyltransferase n=1 Tax=Vibrio sp. F13 TaxID=2070777 RepID=UPI0010BD561B|nr:acyltransferase [Vibrio sp. F13]TKG10169.1 acyltransferase [Vibrio sp. F13]